MEKPKKHLRANQLDSISHKYVDDDQLQDTPARLYRKLLHKMDMNPRKWISYLRDYLDWRVTTADPDKAKEERTTRTGNIKDTYFQKPGLTFSKFLEGLSILRMAKVEIIFRITDTEGKVYEVSEIQRIVGKDRAQLPPVRDDEPESS
jgi:hypothetical protein